MTDCNLGFSNKEGKFCRESAPSNLIGANGFAEQVRSSDGFCQGWEQPIAYRFLRAIPAGSKGLVPRNPQSAWPCRSHRSTPWPMLSGRVL
jgi:hypothetical protein